MVRFYHLCERRRPIAAIDPKFVRALPAVERGVALGGVFWKKTRVAVPRPRAAQAQLALEDGPEDSGDDANSVHSEDGPLSENDDEHSGDGEDHVKWALHPSISSALSFPLH